MSTVSKDTYLKNKKFDVNSPFSVSFVFSLLWIQREPEKINLYNNIIILPIMVLVGYLLRYM